VEAAEVLEAEPIAEPVKEEPAEKKKKQQPTQVLAPIVVDAKSQMMVAHSNSDLVRMIKIFMAGASLPKTLDTEAKVITAWQAAASLKVPPIIAIQNMAIIHGSLSIWGQLPKALAEATGEMRDFKLILFDDKQDVICLEKKNLHAQVWGAAVQIKRARRALNEYYFTEPEAKAAGLFGKSGPWKDYKKIMYARRAMGHAIKFEFPDALMGLSIAEYDFHEAPDLKDVGPTINPATELNKALEVGSGET
jgi:hypothetical protein